MAKQAQVSVGENAPASVHRLDAIDTSFLDRDWHARCSCGWSSPGEHSMDAAASAHMRHASAES